jgi:hypothetical protein
VKAAAKEAATAVAVAKYRTAIVLGASLLAATLAQNSAAAVALLHLYCRGSISHMQIHFRIKH